jgi:hypothetical protein
MKNKEKEKKTAPGVCGVTHYRKAQHTRIQEKG